MLYIVDVFDILDGSVEVKYENFLYNVSKRREEEINFFINIWERSVKIIGVFYGDEVVVIL